MKVVPVEEADAVFKGTITNIYISAVAHHATGLVSNRVTVENRLFVTLDIRCEEKQSHKILWRDPAFVYHKVYPVNDDPLQPDPIGGYENRQNTLGVLAHEMSTRIHDRFLSNF